MKDSKGFWKVQNILQHLSLKVSEQDDFDLPDNITSFFHNKPILAYDQYGNLGEAIFTEKDGQIIITTKEEVEE